MVDDLAWTDLTFESFSKHFLPWLELFVVGSNGRLALELSSHS